MKKLFGGKYNTRVTHFNTFNALKSLYMPVAVCEDIAVDPKDYHYDGAKRDFDNPHTIFQYTISGCGRIRHKDKTFDVPPGHAFLCNSHSPDICYYLPDSADQPWKIVFVTFLNMEKVTEELTERFGPVHWIPSHSPCLELINHYLNLESDVVEFTPSKGFDLANAIISQIVSSSVNDANTSDDRSQVATRAVEYIYENISTALTVEKVASELMISREHLSRIFKKELDSTPLHFINSAKIRYSCKLLKTTSFSVKQIAHALGYDNPSQFARVFKRIAGISPSRFRESKAMPFI